MPANVFISYSRKDSDYVGRLTAHLRARGVAAWFDKDIQYSAQWWQAIVEQMRSADSVIVVMTDALEESEWVVKEVLLARRENKPVFPLLLQGDGLPLLIDIQHYDVTGGAMPSDEFVRALLGSRAPAVDRSRSEVDMQAVVRELERQEETLAAAGRAVAAGRADTKVHVVRAHALNELLRSAEAAEAADAALALSPADRDALYEKATALGALDDDPGALVLLDRILARQPDWAPALGLRASSLGSIDLAEGLKWSERAFAVDPRDLDVLCARCVLLALDGKPAEALAAAEAAIDIEPGRGWGYLAKAFCLNQAGTPEEARSLIDSLSLIYPRSDLVHLFRALIEFGAADYVRAEQAARLALELNPARIVTYQLLALILITTDRSEPALAVYRQARAVIPEPPRTGDAAILGAEGLLLRRLGHQAEGRERIEHGHQANPDASEPLTGLALYAVDDGNPDLARRYLERAWRVDRDASQVELAMTLFELAGDPDRAMMLAEAAVAAGTGSATILQNYAVFLSERDRPEDAVHALRRAQEAVPVDDGPARAQLMLLEGLRLAQDLGRDEEARQVLLRARDLDPANPLVLVMLTKLASAGDSPDEVTALIEEALRPGAQPAVTFNAADVLLRDRRATEALRILDAAVFPPDDWAVPMLRARCLLALSRFDEALSAFHRVEPALTGMDDLQRGEALRLKAELLRLAGRTDEARQALHDAREAAAGEIGPLLSMIMLALDEGDLEAAVTFVADLHGTESGELASDVVAVADRLYEQGSLQTTLDLLDHVDPASTEHGNAIWLRTKTLYRLGRPRPALAALRQVLARLPGELGPSHSHYFDLQGRLLFDLDRIPEARTAYQRALRLDPESPRSLTGLAAVEMREGNFAAAVRATVEAVRLDEEWAFLEAIGTIAEALRRARHTPEALRIADAVLAAGGDSVAIRVLRVRSLQDLGRVTEELDAIADLADAVPGSLSVQEEAVSRLFQEDRWEATLRCAERARALGSDKPEIYVAMALAQINLGRPADAVHAADRALELDGTDTWARVREQAVEAKESARRG